MTKNEPPIDKGTLTLPLRKLLIQCRDVVSKMAVEATSKANYARQSKRESQLLDVKQ